MPAHQIEIKPIHPMDDLLDDVLMVLLMWPLQCFRWEAVQRTHPWNNHHLKEQDVSYLNRGVMVGHQGDPQARRPWLFGFIPLFHFACFGGWKKYMVIEPLEHITGEWYPGWIASNHAVGVSRLPILGSVKLLTGPGACQYFGVTANGTQVALRVVGYGQLGKGGPWRMVPLR